jgi:drug/metabolite transporter (DMT)-like permease
MSYMMTFFFLGLVLFLYFRFWKREKFTIKGEKFRGIAGFLETLGQVFYVLAMSGSAIIAAPLIASYAVFSVILGHIFFKERLTKLQYLAIILVVIGTFILGIEDF